ncbi:MAG: putative cell wall-binding protein [Phenylobacterium sp.]|jgi:putative cell wall-binding protein
MKSYLNKILSILMLLLSPLVCADMADIAALDGRVSVRVSQIEQLNLLLNSDEIDTLKADMISEEINTTNLTAEQASEKYQLSSHLTRYIHMKTLNYGLYSGGGDGLEPPE